MKKSFGLFSPISFLLSTAIAVTSGYFTPALSQSRQTAVVFDPPSNVRLSPNGKVICSVGAVSNINIYGSTQGWYITDVCGSRGYIHNSQIRLQSNAAGQVTSGARKALPLTIFTGEGTYEITAPNKNINVSAFGDALSCHQFNLQ